MSYEEVVDVEKGLTSDAAVVALARQRYPVVNSDIEALFLGRLDDAIDNSTFEIKLPRLQIDKLSNGGETSTSIAEVVNSLKLPTYFLFVSVTSAVLSVLSNNPLLNAAFPYVSCILTFLSTVPSIRKRFLAKSSVLFTQFDSTKSQAEDAIDGVASRGLQLLHTTESAMHQALAPINAKLAAITRVESMLKKVKPDIDIPDPSDVKRSFDGFSEKLQTGCSSARRAIDVSRSLPSPFQSAEKFELYIVFPYLAAMLMIQLSAVYVALTNQDEVPENSVDKDEPVNDWHLILTAFQTYLTAVLQIALVFVLTQTRSLLLFLNNEIARFEGNINGELRRRVGGVFEEIFRRGFKLVRSKFLDLLNKVNKLEEPLQKLKASFPDTFDDQEFSELVSVFKMDVTSKLQKKRKNIFKHVMSSIFGKD